MTQTPQERMNSISEQGLCIGCGICQSIAGPAKIDFCKSSNGYERPVIVGDLETELVEKIFDICPGTRIEGLPDGEVLVDTKIDNVWGPWRRMARAFAGDEMVRFEGSTGGVLTALAQFLLHDKRVEFILHVKASNTDPTFGERHLSFTVEEVLQGAGSRYGPSAPLIDIADVLDRNQSFAFIGKPCDIAALRNYARHDNRVNQLVKFWLTPVCGGFMPPMSMDAFLGRAEIKPEDVVNFRYRGRGCPGPTRIETQDGSVKEFHYLDLWGDDESQWHLPFRCKICPDGIGEAADIAASDTWLGGSPNRVDSETDLGTNGMVARTKAGVDLMEAAHYAGFLSIEYDITPDEMSIYQPHQMRKKYSVHDRHQGLEDEGRIVPVTQRLRIKELAEELPQAFRDDQREGTGYRVANGKASEPTPKRSE